MLVSIVYNYAESAQIPKHSKQQQLPALLLSSSPPSQMISRNRVTSRYKNIIAGHELRYTELRVIAFGIYTDYIIPIKSLTDTDSLLLKIFVDVCPTLAANLIIKIIRWLYLKPNITR
ncbi:MAG TPA: hypothetical protein VH796_15105 [Nitrososphaeraceae archaeon]